MPFSNLLVHSGTLLRRPAPTAEFGTPEDSPRTVVATFPCRLSWEGGFETADPRSDQKPQTRTGRVFIDYSDVDVILRGDLVRVDPFGVVFEVEFNRLIWGAAAPHHWELDVRQVEGA